jgi:hypothetical protein
VRVESHLARAFGALIGQRRRTALAGRVDLESTTAGEPLSNAPAWSIAAFASAEPS